MTTVVVKLGGSTAVEAELRAWIAALASSSLSLVIVPGGGPFADTVREMQKQIGFSDAAAHAMAILAMEQLGHVILDLNDRFVAARSSEEIISARSRGKIPVWFPSAMALAAPGIPASWEITSDSLAAWLAGHLGASTVLLIKQSGDFSVSDDVASLAAKGIVDPALAAMLPAGAGFYLAGPRHAAGARAALAAGKLPGTRIAATPLRKSA